MNVVKPEKPAEDRAVATAVEGEIRDFVRRDVVAQRKPQPDITSDTFATNMNAVIERVAGTSIKEIDNLIAELQSVREFLHAEAERVQREISGYAHVSQTAMSSVKIIAESMGQWKTSVAPPRTAERR